MTTSFPRTARQPGSHPGAKLQRKERPGGGSEARVLAPTRSVREGALPARSGYFPPDPSGWKTPTRSRPIAAPLETSIRGDWGRWRSGELASAPCRDLSFRHCQRQLIGTRLRLCRPAVGVPLAPALSFARSFHGALGRFSVRRSRALFPAILLRVGSRPAMSFPRARFQGLQDDAPDQQKTKDAGDQREFHGFRFTRLSAQGNPIVAGKFRPEGSRQIMSENVKRATFWSTPLAGMTRKALAKEKSRPRSRGSSVR